MCLRQCREIASLQMRSEKRSVGYRHTLNGREAHVEIRGEGVENLMRAHMRVSVDDALRAAFYAAWYERHCAVMGSVRICCALALCSHSLDLGRYSRGSTCLRWTTASVSSWYTSGLRIASLVGWAEATPAQLSASWGHLPID